MTTMSGRDQSSPRIPKRKTGLFERLAIDPDLERARRHEVHRGLAGGEDAHRDLYVLVVDLRHRTLHSPRAAGSLREEL